MLASRRACKFWLLLAGDVIGAAPMHLCDGGPQAMSPCAINGCMTVLLWLTGFHEMEGALERETARARAREREHFIVEEETEHL